MNILYCGDANIIDGLVISVLSILKNTNSKLNIYILTMMYKDSNKKYKSFPSEYVTIIDKLVKETNKDSSVQLMDITEIVSKCFPTANVNTRFTPYCMLRLYADMIDALPDKLLYLDNDVVCLKNPEEFYNTNIDKYEVVGALDYYGSHLFKQKIYRKDYLNSGVLLLNLEMIRKTRLFNKARKRCKYVRMLLPDQTAINLIAKKKLVVNRKYNEQKILKEDTVFRHFTTTFKFWPKIHTQTIKPWNIKELHDTLNMHEIDDILEKYLKIMEKLKDE